MADIVSTILCGGTFATDAIIAGVGLAAVIGMFTKPNNLGYIALAFGAAKMISKATGVCGANYDFASISP